MQNSGWIEVCKSPIAAGVKPETAILVWHVFQGVLTELCGKIRSNRFYTHWQPLQDDVWIASAERLPASADADEQNCVISRNAFGEISMTGWHRFSDDHTLLYWQAPPKPPMNYRELRKNA